MASPVPMPMYGTQACLALTRRIVGVLPQCAAPGDEEPIGDGRSFRGHLASSCSWQFVSIHTLLLFHSFDFIASFITPYCKARIGIAFSDQKGSTDFFH